MPFFTYVVNINKNPSNIVIVIGEDEESNNNVFKDNANTWIIDNMKPGNTVVLIDVGNSTYTTITKSESGKVSRDIIEKNYETKKEVMEAIRHAFGEKGIDLLIFETHSSETGIHLKGTEYIRYFDLVDYFGNDLSYHDKIKLNDGAVIRFNGCRLGKGGMFSFAQSIADLTGVVVWAAPVKTSQVGLDGTKKTYQMTATEITNGLKKGTIYKDKHGRFHLKKRPNNTGHVKFIPGF